VNLATARRLVEKQMTDSCQVERDRAGYYDDVLDMGTGQLLKRPLTPEVVWSGPCLVAPTSVGQTVEGARVMERRGYRVRLPYDSPQLLRGDRLTITSSADDQLLGRVLVLNDSSQAATMDHCTILLASDVDPVAAQ
jgi:hypothetical protein